MLPILYSTGIILSQHSFAIPLYVHEKCKTI